MEPKETSWRIGRSFQWYTYLRFSCSHKILSQVRNLWNELHWNKPIYNLTQTCQTIPFDRFVHPMFLRGRYPSPVWLSYYAMSGFEFRVSTVDSTRPIFHRLHWKVINFLVKSGIPCENPGFLEAGNALKFTACTSCCMIKLYDKAVCIHMCFFCCSTLPYDGVVSCHCVRHYLAISSILCCIMVLYHVLASQVNLKWTQPICESGFQNAPPAPPPPTCHSADLRMTP